MGGSFIAQRSGYDREAVAAREADVTGKPQRIAPLAPEEVSQATRDLVDRIRASAGAAPATQIPEYFRTTMRHPEIFRCQLEMGDAIYNGRIPPREREIAVLRVGWLSRAPYEWGEHVAIGKRCGLSPEEIARVIEGSAAPGWSAHEAAILRGVEELLSEQMISDATWATLSRSWDEPQLIEFPMMVGQYVATGYVQNALRIRLGPGNAGLTMR